MIPSFAVLSIVYAQKNPENSNFRLWRGLKRRIAKIGNPVRLEGRSSKRLARLFGVKKKLTRRRGSRGEEDRRREIDDICRPEGIA
jgi:hypothetical protein